MVFHPDGRTARVGNASEQAAYLAAGWSLTQTPVARGVTRIPAGVVSTLIAPVTPKLRTMKIVNDSTQILRLLYGDGASATSYTWILDPGERWEMPSVVEQGVTKPDYTGLITGIWDSAVGAAQVTITEYP